MINEKLCTHSSRFTACSCFVMGEEARKLFNAHNETVYFDIKLYFSPISYTFHHFCIFMNHRGYKVT